MKDSHSCVLNKNALQVICVARRRIRLPLSLSLGSRKRSRRSKSNVTVSGARKNGSEKPREALQKLIFNTKHPK